ncbi:hypothetical protein H2201_008773 [Coniosporium apollinis]|uniref:Uncharacterized protein n=2 Tax=Coniosporium TaxID=2810619 RepID=A0ABQ9NFX6_9PEZI|nr:hypothetical protein H2199_009188 [Cladosporium sp. JES 115]KAJ9655603.1 hypothetical protein H2201_008773 [Coniosporium apollinis]
MSPWTPPSRPTASSPIKRRARILEGLMEVILVFSESGDCDADMQILVDLLLSENGRLHTLVEDDVCQPIPIYFS